MKNLILHSISKLNVKCKLKGSHFTICDKYFCYIRDGKLYRHNLNEDDGEAILLSGDFLDHVTSIDGLNLEKKVVLTTAGILHVVCIDTLKTVEINVSKPVTNLKFNYGETCTVITFEDETVGTYQPFFEDGNLDCLGLTCLDAQEKLRAYTGWGSENTQFRGSQGKYAPVPKPKVCPVADKKPTISWHSNDEMFVVNYLEDGERVFKVFEMPCVPLYKSYKAYGLQPPIAWRPDREAMACSFLVDDNYQLHLYEKSGYFFKAIDLTDSCTEVVELKWSNCSTVLAVKQKHSNGHFTLSLFTKDNASFHMKQHLIFSEDKKLLFFKFNDTETNFIILTVVTTEGVVTYTFQNGLIRSLSTEIVAVIKGISVRITDFRKGTLPPPMYEIQFTAQSPINFVEFHPTKPEYFIVMDASNIVYLTSFDGTSKMLTDLRVEQDFPLTHSCFWQYETGNIRDNTSLIKSTAEQIVYPLFDRGSCLVFCDGKAHRFDRESCDGKELEEEILVSTCNFDLIPCDLQARVYNGQLFVFILTVCNKLYVDYHKVLDDVRAFVISDDYLFVTYYDYRVVSYRIGFIQKNGTCLPLFNKLTSNYMEPCSMPISVIKDRAEVLLCAARGNIETMFSDMIGIDILNEMLQKNLWNDAVNFVYSSKLNSNLLFDLNPEEFLNNTYHIVRNCDQSVLTSIIPEFMSKNFLSIVFKDREDAIFTDYPGKVDAICEKLLNTFEMFDYAEFIKPVICICIHHFTVKRALSYVGDLLVRSTEEKNNEIQQIAEKSINIFKQYGIDGNTLYEEALSLYDLNLARFVTRQCQLDPLIYDEELRTLENMSLPERHFTINDKLGNYGKAVYYLLRIDKEKEEIIKYLKNHNVFKEACDPINVGTTFYKDAAIAYAENLSQKGLHNEAGHMLARVELFDLAIKEFRVALNITEIFNMLDLGHFDDETKIRIQKETATEFATKGKYVEAGNIMRSLEDYRTAVSLFMKGYCFDQVYLILELHEVYKDPSVDQQFLNYVDYLYNRITDVDTTFNNYVDRLKRWRTKVESSLRNGELLGKKEEFLFPGAETSSNSSTMSNYSSLSRSSWLSTISSRNRRKEERKMKDLKQGGVYEDIALLRALHETYVGVKDLTEQVNSVCKVIIQYKHLPHQKGTKLYDELSKLRMQLKHKEKEIWPDYLNQVSENKTAVQVALLGNIDCLEMKYRFPPDMDYEDTLISFSDTS